jgi:Putative transmembrane protein (PGPGW)
MRLPISSLHGQASLGFAGYANRNRPTVARCWSWMLQYEVKAARASLVAGWLLTIGGIIGLVLPVLPGLPFLLLGLSTLSKRYGWARRVTTWLNSLFVDQATPRS